MSLVGTEQLADHFLSRRELVIALAIFALVTSLMARVPSVTFSAHPCVHANSSLGKIQHRDKDASQWVPPDLGASLVWLIEPSVCSEPSGRPAVRLYYDSLLNRPPPSL
jgi:hypothetical protein